MAIKTFIVLMEKPSQNDANIVAGIDAKQIEVITTNVLDFAGGHPRGLGIKTSDALVRNRAASESVIIFDFAKAAHVIRQSSRQLGCNEASFAVDAIYVSCQ